MNLFINNIDGLFSKNPGNNHDNRIIIPFMLHQQNDGKYINNRVKLLYLQTKAYI